jgi:hypothetical protein
VPSLFFFGVLIILGPVDGMEYTAQVNVEVSALSAGVEGFAFDVLED